MRRAALALTLLLGVPFAGGVQEEKVEKGTAPSRRLRPSPDPLLQGFLRKYEFADASFAWQLKEVRAAEKYVLSWLTFPSALQGDVEENNTVWAKVWQPRDGRPRRPAAVVLHWLGGSFDLLEVVCQRLAENGVTALMMYMPYYGPRRAKDPEKRQKLLNLDMDRTIANVRQAVLDARRAGDWLAARPDVEPSRVGLVGISLGAVIGSLTAGVDDRFGRSVFLIGGGDLPAIILHGSKETADQKRKLEEAGLTADKLRELWKEIEPCTFASRLRPEEILMINAEADEVIPKEATLKLAAAAGGPEVRWLKGGHYALLFQLGPALKDIQGHLSQRTAYARLEDPVPDAGR
jgi:dienelactone hydrolase